MVLVFVCLSSFAVFASEEYILKKEMTYTNTKNYTLSDGFVEIMIGQKDFIDYQKDDWLINLPLYAIDQIKAETDV